MLQDLSETLCSLLKDIAFYVTLINSRIQYPSEVIKILEITGLRRSVTKCSCIIPGSSTVLAASTFLCTSTGSCSVTHGI